MLPRTHMRSNQETPSDGSECELSASADDSESLDAVVRFQHLPLVIRIT